MVEIARSELILGGQRSGKSRRAEMLARQWLDASPDHRAVLIATGQAWDDEMRERIARHQRDRALRLPGMVTVEEPVALADALQQHAGANTLIVVDCLTLWLTNCSLSFAASTMGGVPLRAAAEAACPDAEILIKKQALAQVNQARTALVLEAIADPVGPLVLVSNEIGLGVIPMGNEVRQFVDALGRLNQQVAAACERVTLMAAGLPLRLKGTT